MKTGGMCFNWKVVAGLAVVGLGIWAVAPNLVGAALPLLILAACPLSMLLMMRGMGGMGGGQCASQPEQAGQPALGGRSRDEQLADLKAQLSSLQVQQEGLAREISHLEAEDSPAVREAEAVARAAGERVRG